jgi:SAM-dependent methyltransferase
VSASYDAIAPAYAVAFETRKPFDRGILADFARLVSDSTAGLVLDAGCGPGHAGSELAAAGLEVLGLDRSSVMIDIARKRCPSAQFAIADIGALPLADASCAAVCSWYSIIHTPADGLPELFAEFRRVLTGGGWALLAFQTNAPTLEFTTAFGHDVDLRFLRHHVDEVLATLSAAGLTPHTHTVRERDGDAGETADQAFVIARSNRVP